MRRALVSFVAVLGLVLASGVQAQDPNLVGWWPLSAGSGEMAFDVSGSGMHGTINNAANGLGADGAVWVFSSWRRSAGPHSTGKPIRHADDSTVGVAVRWL